MGSRSSLVPKHPSVRLHLAASRSYPQGAKALATSREGEAPGFQSSGPPTGALRITLPNRANNARVGQNPRSKPPLRITHSGDRYLERYLSRPVVDSTYNKVAVVAVELNPVRVRVRALRAHVGACARAYTYV
jgi:hypothetical protein